MQLVFWNQLGRQTDKGELCKAPCEISTTVPLPGPKVILCKPLRTETSLDLCAHECFLRLNVLLFFLPVQLLFLFHIWFKCHLSDLCSKQCSFGYKLLKEKAKYILNKFTCPLGQSGCDSGIHGNYEQGADSYQDEMATFSNFLLPSLSLLNSLPLSSGG